MYDRKKTNPETHAVLIGQRYRMFDDGPTRLCGPVIRRRKWLDYTLALSCEHGVPLPWCGTFSVTLAPNMHNAAVISNEKNCASVFFLFRCIVEDCRLQQMYGDSMPKSTAKKPRERVAREEAIAEGGRRKLILDAAVESVLVDGYARTNMSHVARRAGVPRPLVQYYFSNLPMLMRAAIEAIAERWRTSYFSSVRVAAPNGAMGVDKGIDYLWSHMHSPEYLAYQELLLIARTDPEVAELVVELHQEDVRRRREDAAIAYSEYAAADAQAFADTGEFTAIFLEGLLLRQLRMSDQMLETDRQLSMLKHFLGTYWANHGLPQAALTAATPPPTGNPEPVAAEEFAKLASELIRKLQPFARPT